jgi:hypothetical protein
MRKIIRHLFACLAVASVGVMGLSFQVYATCLDAKPSVAKEFAKAPLVVVGAATESHNVPDLDDPDGYSYTIYVVKVSKVLKGPATDHVWLFSVNTSSRYPMDIGKPHLLFLTRDLDDYYADDCGNSGPLDEQKKEYAEVQAILSKKGKPIGGH